MITRCLPFCFVVFCLFCFAAPAVSQPLLPDLAGNTQKGYNIISWTSQYDVFKSVSVQRSADSVYNYTTIGYVKGVKKGVQAYIDGHPLPGKNWYRLYILFNSDLTWYSNRFMIFVDSAELLKQPVLPPNDSLQKYVASMISKAATEITTPATSTSGRPDNRTTPATTPKTPVSGTTTTVPRTTANTGTAITTNPRLVPQPPSGNTATPPNTEEATPEPPPPPPPKLVLTLPDTDPNGVDAYAYVKSQFVFTNPFTGHVNVEIRDAKQYHYSLWFFDAKEVKVLEIPAITQPAIIIDKRNFSHKGIYRFELIRDREKLETGFITIY